MRGRQANIIPAQDQMKMLKLGTVVLDGATLHAHASQHSALTYGHAERIEAQLQAEVQELLNGRSQILPS